MIRYDGGSGDNLGVHGSEGLQKASGTKQLGCFIIVQEPWLLGRREKWRLGLLSPYLDPGLKGRKTDRDHEQKALLLHRVQGLTRYNLARGRKEVIDSCIGRAVNKPPFHLLHSFLSQWETLIKFFIFPTIFCTFANTHIYTGYILHQILHVSVLLFPLKALS